MPRQTPLDDLGSFIPRLGCKSRSQVAQTALDHQSRARAKLQFAAKRVASEWERRNFSDRLKALAAAQGWGKRELSRRLDVPRTTLDRFFKGEMDAAALPRLRAAAARLSA